MNSQVSSVDGLRRAVFLDRDGTLIEHIPYLGRVDQVRLLPGVAAGIRRLNLAGWLCIVVTNQSAIGRGWITVDDMHAVNAEVQRQLAEHGARLDAFYFCPDAPGTSDRTVVENLDRKPGPGMLLRAAREWQVHLGRSAMIGDMASDILAGRNAGCLTNVLVQVEPHFAQAWAALAADPPAVAADFLDAVAQIVGTKGPSSPPQQPPP